MLISFENVTLGYMGQKTILKHVTFFVIKKNKIRTDREEVTKGHPKMTSPSKGDRGYQKYYCRGSFKEKL